MLTMMPPVWANVQPQLNTSYKGFFEYVLSKKNTILALDREKLLTDSCQQWPVFTHTQSIQ